MAAATETLSPALPEAVEQAAARVLELACRKDLSIATAESCTGGLLSSLLTDIEGRSHAFDRGFVVYSKSAKCDLLGLRREMIDDCGAVSEPVARAMAQGAIDRSDGGIALAITGFAGSGGPDEEAGLVHFACAVRGGGTTHRREHFGAIGRGPIRIACMAVALEMIEEALA